MINMINELWVVGTLLAVIPWSQIIKPETSGLALRLYGLALLILNFWLYKYL